MTENADDGAPRRDLFLAPGLSPSVVAVVHREALLVLRHDLDTADLDAYGDRPWPPEVLPAYERALALARAAVARGARPRRADPAMGIDVDVRDDAQFEVLLALAPYTINIEGRCGRLQVFGAADSGTSLWVAVTPAQEAELRARLNALGVPPTALATRDGSRRS